jgi:hypothetical protein
MGPLQMESEIPDWVPRYETGKGYRGGGSQHISLWEEDDAHPPDGEKLDAAWSRIFGCLRSGKLGHYDGGDAFYTFYYGNRVAVASPCGNAIYQYLPARKFD